MLIERELFVDLESDYNEINDLLLTQDLKMPKDIDYTVDCLKEIVADIRNMSPLYEDFLKKQRNR